MTAVSAWVLALAGGAALGAPRDSLPPMGVAVALSDSVWCAEFRLDSTARLGVGTPVTIVLAAPAGPALMSARIRGSHAGDCPTAFPQPRWFDYTAYVLEVDRSRADDSLPIVALVVASRAPWRRGADGVVRADLDGDGALEEVRRCTADEGEHFTVWSARSGGGLVRRWHEYFDWGGLTDPTCGPGEDGREPSTIDAG